MEFIVVQVELVILGLWGLIDCGCVDDFNSALRVQRFVVKFVVSIDEISVYCLLPPSQLQSTYSLSLLLLLYRVSKHKNNTCCWRAIAVAVAVAVGIQFSALLVLLLTL